MITDSLQAALQYDPRDPRNKPPGFFKDPALESKTDSERYITGTPGRQVSARVFPNGEFGVGFVPPRGISAQDRRYEHERRDSWDNAEIVPDVQISPDGEQMHYTRVRIPKIPNTKLGTGSKSSQPSKRYGLKGITGYGRKMLRNAGHLMDEACKGRYNRKLCMGTVTVPSYCEDSMKNICSHWGDIQRRFFQECKRLYERFRYRFDYASCTEIQPQRLENRGEVGLHIHFLHIAIRLGRGKWVLPHSWVRATWGRILADYLVDGEDSQEPNYRHDVVNTSGAAYIAKYVSKGAGDIRRVIEGFGEDFLPRQWWSVSSLVRKCIHAHTIRSSSHIADMLLCVCSNGMEEYYRYIRVCTLETHANEYAKAHDCPTEIVLGYGGLLSSAGKSLFIPGNQSESIKRYLSRTLDKSRRN